MMQAFVVNVPVEDKSFVSQEAFSTYRQAYNFLHYSRKAYKQTESDLVDVYESTDNVYELHKVSIDKHTKYIYVLLLNDVYVPGITYTNVDQLEEGIKKIYNAYKDHGWVFKVPDSPNIYKIKELLLI